MQSFLHWIAYDTGYAEQIALLVCFVLVSASVEYRRTGIILSCFAVLYLGLIPLNGVMDNISPPTYALLYLVMDTAAIRLLFAYRDKGSRRQIVILSAFVSCHFMAWLYTMGYPSILDPLRFGVLTFCLIVAQLLVSIPMMRRGLYEGSRWTQEALADYRYRHQLLRAYHSGSDSDPLSSRGSCDISGDDSRSPGVHRVFPFRRLAPEDL